MLPDLWPFSDHVYVVTTATPPEVARWAAVLHPDLPAVAGHPDEPPPLPIPPGTHAVVLWWD
jgi:hypothetical protein